jgi:hypothetical protein
MQIVKSLSKKRFVLPLIGRIQKDTEFSFVIRGLCSEKEALYLSSMLIEASKSIVVTY